MDWLLAHLLAHLLTIRWPVNVISVVQHTISDEPPHSHYNPQFTSSSSSSPPHSSLVIYLNLTYPPIIDHHTHYLQVLVSRTLSTRLLLLWRHHSGHSQVECFETNRVQIVSLDKFAFFAHFFLLNILLNIVTFLLQIPAWLFPVHHSPHYQSVNSSVNQRSSDRTIKRISNTLRSDSYLAITVPRRETLSEDQLSEFIDCQVTQWPVATLHRTVSLL